MSFVPEFIRSYADSARKVQEHWTAQLEETIASVTESAKDKLPNVSEESVAKGVDDFFDAWVNAIESQRTQTKTALANRLADARTARARVGELEERGRAQADSFMEAARTERDAVTSRLESQLRVINEQFQGVREAARGSAGSDPVVVPGSVVTDSNQSDEAHVDAAGEADAPRQSVDNEDAEGQPLS